MTNVHWLRQWIFSFGVHMTTCLRFWMDRIYFDTRWFFHDVHQFIFKDKKTKFSSIFTWFVLMTLWSFCFFVLNIQFYSITGPVDDCLIDTSPWTHRQSYCHYRCFPLKKGVWSKCGNTYMYYTKWLREKRFLNLRWIFGVWQNDVKVQLVFLTWNLTQPTVFCLLCFTCHSLVKDGWFATKLNGPTF